MRTLEVVADDVVALSVKIGSWVHLNHAGRVMDVAPAFTDTFDIGQWQTIFAESLTPASRLLWCCTILPALALGGDADEVPLTLLGSDGRTWPSLSYWRPHPHRDGYLGILLPGVERHRLLFDLDRANDTLQCMPGAILQLACDHEGKVSVPYASASVLELLGTTPSMVALEPERLFAALTNDSSRALRAACRDASKRCLPEWRLVLTPATAVGRQLELVARGDGHQGAWYAVLTDVSEREWLQKELARSAQTDALTGLHNRSSLMLRLRALIAAGDPFAVFFMDCDRFKQINDSLGHDAGDELLRQLADRLHADLRREDTTHRLGTGLSPHTAARLGGDEFVIVMASVSDEAALHSVADRLLRLASQPYVVHGIELVVSVSIGAVLGGPTSHAGDLLRDADTAMYEAKRQGRGRWATFSLEMHQRVAEALALEADLRQALREGQLRVAYQPIVDLCSGAVVGLEALARWRHPIHGEISPTRFIAVAEDSGLVGQLGDQILRQACEQLAAWRLQGVALDVVLSVNLSRAQLADTSLPERVANLLGDLCLSPRLLQLELTESLAMGGSVATEVMASLRRLGVRLSIDDFGTGHSSLASLERFPVQQVKIDRTFVQDIEDKAYHHALVRAIVQVAEVLGLDVVAEGVETESQAAVLRALHCNKAQGWLYSKAVEPESVPGLWGA